jgi:O-antigen ligase
MPSGITPALMLVAIVFGFAVVQLLLALAAPKRFLSFTLLFQAVPFTWTLAGPDSFIATPIGSLNIVALQTFFLCLASFIVLIANAEQTASYLLKYRLHVLFLFFCLISILYAPSISYALRMVAKLAGPLLFLLAILVVVDDPGTISNLRRAVLYGGLILVALALLARTLGIVSDPNAINTGIAGLGPPGMGAAVFAAHMLPVTMLALAIYITERRFIHLLIAVIAAASVLGALQRTCAAALFAGASLILYLGTRGFTRVLLPAFCLLSFPPLLIFSDTFRRRMFFDRTDAHQLLQAPMSAFSSVNGSGRFDLWSSLLDKFFVGHQVLGSGMGATQEYLYTQSQAGAGVVHSEYVRLLCEVGVTGLLLFASAMVAYLLSITNSYKAARSSAYPIAAVASLLCYLIYMMTDNAFDYVNQFGCYVFALIALAAKIPELEASTDRRPLEQPSMILANLMR